MEERKSRKKPERDIMYDFSGKNVLITGASRGIGRGIAMKFGKAHANLCLHHRSGDAEMESLKRLLREAGSTVESIRADLSGPDGTGELFTRFSDYFTSLDVLVNCAGIYPVEPLVDMEDDVWDRMIEINLNSVFRCVREASRMMIRDGVGGSIVNIGSIEGENPGWGHSHYSASKSGIITFTKAAAQELGEHGIRVNCVSPGLIWKDGLDKEWPDGVQRYLAKVPLGRLGTPEDIGDACLFLSSSSAGWVTGINLRVDGGVGTGAGY